MLSPPRVQPRVQQQKGKARSASPEAADASTSGVAKPRSAAQRYADKKRAAIENAARIKEELAAAQEEGSACSRRSACTETPTVKLVDWLREREEAAQKVAKVRRPTKRRAASKACGLERDRTAIGMMLRLLSSTDVKRDIRTTSAPCICDLHLLAERMVVAGGMLRAEQMLLGLPIYGRTRRRNPPKQPRSRRLC